MKNSELLGVYASGYATVMSPINDETAVCGSHCLDCDRMEIGHHSNQCGRKSH